MTTIIILTVITSIVFVVLFVAASTSDTRMALKILKTAKEQQNDVLLAIKLLKEKEAYLNELEQHILNRVKAEQ